MKSSAIKMCHLATLFMTLRSQLFTLVLQFMLSVLRDSFSCAFKLLFGRASKLSFGYALKLPFGPAFKLSFGRAHKLCNSNPRSVPHSSFYLVLLASPRFKLLNLQVCTILCPFVLFLLWIFSLDHHFGVRPLRGGTVRILRYNRHGFCFGMFFYFVHCFILFYCCGFSLLVLFQHWLFSFAFCI